jgi:hypothetical protein
VEGAENRINYLRHELKIVLANARDFNKQDQPTRSRELSLAITSLEEAAHWLRDIVDKE